MRVALADLVAAGGMIKVRANLFLFALETGQPLRFRIMPRVTITVPERNAQPYRFQLDRQVVTLGRGSENDIAIDSGSVSVNHAEMHRIEGGYELRDVGSTNGIKLDGERYDVIPLRTGAAVTIGDVAFDFVLTDEENETLSHERRASLPPISRDDTPVISGKPTPKRVTYVQTKPEGSGFGAMVLFLILAALAFFGGLFIRHQKETGGNLIDAIKARPAANAAPAAPTPPTTR